MLRRIAFVGSVLLTLGAGTVMAQGGMPMGGQGGGRGQFMQRRVERLLQGITLTAAQQHQVDSIVSATSAQMPAFTPGQMPDSATRAHSRALMDSENAAIRALLTPDEQKIWDTNVQNQPMRRGMGGGGR